MALAQNIQPPMTQQEEYHTFFLGLHPTVRERVLSRQCVTVTEAFNAGRAVLSELVTVQGGGGGGGHHQAQPLQVKARPKGACHGCGKECHHIKDCWHQGGGKGRGGGRTGGRGGRSRSTERKPGKGSGRGTTQGRSRSPAK